MSLTETIRERIEKALHPTHLEVLNESRNHSVPAGSESHFKVVVVSAAFTGKSLLDRHRSVNGLFPEELRSGRLHALALHTYAPEEWQSRSPNSPPCQGGNKL